MEYISYVAGILSIPFTALGGINKDNAGAVVRAGARCCSILTGILSQPDLRLAIYEIRAGMRAAGQGGGHG
jgi:thiamine-phosphate pyrophosphorylase